MRLDLVLPNQGGFAEEALRAGPHFEAMGWDGLWLTDHVVGAAAYARHNAGYGAHWQEIMVSMAWLAAAPVTLERTARNSVRRLSTRHMTALRWLRRRVPLHRMAKSGRVKRVSG